jgi:ferredoxin-NADP reductase/Na+-translocating ferredoxin:NAD+ oxidoreductase RnfD subunit
MTRSIDRFLDHITMYRLVLYYLVTLLAAAMALGALGVVPHNPVDIAFSTLVLLGSCWATNRVFARVFNVPANSESTYITAIILALIVEPMAPANLAGVGMLVFVSIWAMASKFMLAAGRKHVFNPAAFGVVLSALLLNQPATWWVGGNLPLLPFVLAGGVLIVRKLRCFDLVATFILVDLATVLVTADPAQYGMVLRETLLSSPLFFFGFVMLTEPLTAPTMRWPRLVFAALVGVLFAPNVHIGSVYLTPELALLAGNLFALATGPRGRFILTLERIEQSAADTYDFIFRSPRRLAFSAGQYLEWTLGLDRPDNRGNRRYFTIASAPTEDEVRLGVKFYPASSAFKRGLASMAPGDTIHVSQLAGNFVLPADPRAKLAFLAGGVGITPFRSMLQTLIDRGETRSIVVLYGSESQEDIAYGDVLDQARRELGVRTIHAVARNARAGQYPGYIDATLVREAIPDYRERVFYISGPQAMVESLRSMLIGIGVPRRRIKTDFFPGFA